MYQIKKYKKACVGGPAGDRLRRFFDIRICLVLFTGPAARLRVAATTSCRRNAGCPATAKRGSLLCTLPDKKHPNAAKSCNIPRSAFRLDFRVHVCSV